MRYLDYDGLETQVDCIKKYVKAETGLVREELRNRANIPIGFEYFSMNPNVPQGSLPLFGGEYSRATYADLWTWVQAQSGYLKTEADWQTLSTSNNGNVPFYSSGDGSTTFRVPSLKCWIKGANGTVTEVGSYLAAGLPNITGSLFSRDSDPSFDMNMTGSGAVAARNEQHKSSASSTNEYNCWTGFDFNAALSNSIYGNSETVQPESIVGMWLVKAYGTIVDTGTIDEQQYIDDRIAALPNTFLPLAGGTMSGAIHFNGANNRSFGFDLTNDCTNMDVGWNWENRDGAGFGLRSTDDSGAGSFSIYARDGSNFTTLNGYPDGRLTWGGYNVITTKRQSVTTQFVTNSVVSREEFARNAAWVSNGFLFVQINMNFISGATTSDITTVGKLKNVNIITNVIEVAVEQNSTFKPGLLCLYNNGSDVDIRVYTVSSAGAGRYGHWFTVPLR